MTVADPTATTASLLDEFRWMVRLRWAAAIMLLAIAGTVLVLLDNPATAGPLAGVALATLAYNTVFWLLVRRRDDEPSRGSLTLIIGSQVLLDLAALGLIVALSGGVDSPLMAFFFLYVVASSLLLSARMAYCAVVAAVALTAGALLLTGEWPRNSVEVPIAIAWPLLLGLSVFLVNHITSDLRRHRARLYRESERYGAILETAADGIITIDGTGEIQTANPACERIFGYSHDEMIGRNIKMLMPEPMRTEHDSYIDNYVRTGEAKIIGIGREVAGRRKNGTTFPVELAVSEIRLGDERLFTGVLRDISHRVESQAELTRLYDELRIHQDAMLQHEKMAAIGQMAAGVAHEIANPLASMDSLIQLVKRKPERMTDRVVEQIQAQVQRISGIVRQLTEFSHPLELGWATVRLNDLINDALDLLRFDHRLRDIDLQLVLPDDGVDVNVVPQAIQQVLVNLLGNAIDALEEVENPTLLITARAEGEDRFIRIQDNGRGIAPEHLSRVFDPFFTTKPIGRGTGLGLSISYSLIQSHQGEIVVESSPGAGACFTVRLPASCPREPGRDTILDSENPTT